MNFLSVVLVRSALHLKSALLSVPERIPESRRNTMHQLIYNGFLCDMIGHIGLFRSKIFIDIHYGTHGIQEVSGSIPLISAKSSLECRKTLKSLDFKVFSYPKVGKSQYSLFAPVRLIFDGNFENQAVCSCEENRPKQQSLQSIISF